MNGEEGLGLGSRGREKKKYGKIGKIGGVLGLELISYVDGSPLHCTQSAHDKLRAASATARRGRAMGPPYRAI